jgi:hypothetical protein
MHKNVTEQGYTSLLELDEAEAARLLCKAGQAEPNPKWINTWRATITGERIVLPECGPWIEGLERPIHHLDFETVGAPLPIVLSTHPFEVVPLQYSIHIEGGPGEPLHHEFMARADDPDPRRSLIEKMLDDLGESGAIIHWSPYENTVITHLAENPLYAEYRDRLLAVATRLRDLGRMVDAGVFDKEFHGRWSIKKVYPVLVPGGKADHLNDDLSPVLTYDDLEGVAKGDEAALLLLEYMRADATEERRDAIRRELMEYCKLDTWATVEVLRVLRQECAPS